MILLIVLLVLILLSGGVGLAVDGMQLLLWVAVAALVLMLVTGPRRYL